MLHLDHFDKIKHNFKQQKLVRSDLLNIECCHGDDVIDVRASANFFDVGEISFKIKQLYHFLKVQGRNVKHNFVSFKKIWLLKCFQCKPADDNEELEQQQSQILLFRFQPIRRFLDTLQQLVAQNLQDVVWKE